MSTSGSSKSEMCGTCVKATFIVWFGTTARKGNMGLSSSVAHTTFGSRLSGIGLAMQHKDFSAGRRILDPVLFKEL